MRDVKYGNQVAYYYKNVIQSMGIDINAEHYFQTTFVEKTSDNSIKFLIMEVKIRYSQYFNYKVISNSSIVLNAMNSQGTVTLGGITSYDNVTWVTTLIS